MRELITVEEQKNMGLIQKALHCSEDRAANIAHVIEVAPISDIDNIKKESFKKNLIITTVNGDKYIVLLNKKNHVDAIKDLQTQKYVYAIIQ